MARQGLRFGTVRGKGIRASIVLASVLFAMLPITPAQAATSIVQVSAGNVHTCALTDAGGVKCWGFNGDGQLGDGTRDGSSTPVNVRGLTSGVVAVSAGYLHTCALTDTGGVKCWGDNEFGQLGDGTTKDRLKPVDVARLASGVQAISSSGYYHTCALTDAGDVKCWGINYRGELGDGTKKDRLKPVDVLWLATGVEAISAGFAHTCALTGAGGVKCWGANFAGQIGDGTTRNRTKAVAVARLSSGVQAISAGGLHTCALADAGGLRCWGGNGYGQLGDGTTIGRRKPVDVSRLTSGVGSVGAGSDHTCAVTMAGGVKCWGWNAEGQVGDGTTHDRSKPVDVSNLGSGVQAVSAGGIHTCALTDAGGVKCWGYNGYGQLGDGTKHDRLRPVDVVFS